MFKIGDFARISRVTIKTLRHYDDIGLFVPVEVDRFTGYRFYSIEQLPRLNRILALKDLGLSLEQIGRLLDEDLSVEEMRGMLKMKQAELRHHIDEEQTRLARVEARLRQIEQEGKMPDYEVVLKQVEPILAAVSVCEPIPSMEAISSIMGRLIGDVSGFVGQHGAFAGPPLALYYAEEEDGKHTNMEVEVAFPVSRPLPESQRVAVRELPAHTMACLVHHGSYDNFNQAYEALGAWVQTNGYQIVGPVREIYLQYDEKNPANNLTEIQFPVEKG
jgi:DNA-binding transcriptional MerR regulator